MSDSRKNDRERPGVMLSRRTALVTGLLTLSACAWTLHPERRGRRPGGSIDTVPLIIDIIWFLPGLVPGIVCLAVDFASGAIYTSGSARLSIKRDGTIVVRRATVDEPTPARVAIIGSQGRVLAQASTVWSAEHSQREDELRLALAELAELSPTPLRLEVQLGDAPPDSFEIELVGEGGRISAGGDGG